MLSPLEHMSQLEPDVVTYIVVGIPFLLSSPKHIFELVFPLRSANDELPVDDYSLSVDLEHSV